MKKILPILIVFFVFVFTAKTARAADAAPASATLAKNDIAAVLPKKDTRAKILAAFLEKQGSPLADHADTFVKATDQYSLDWKLVAAISGVESTFGQAIPSGSYNGWGWGVYGDHVIRFQSWDDAIVTISKGIRENYMDKGAGDNIYAIGRTYAASPAWADHVTYFMNKIDAFADQWTDDSLSITL